MVTDSQRPMDARFFLLFIPVAYGTYLFHELGHWSVGEVLGNPMVYSLNGVWPKDGQYVQAGHALYVSLGGPVFTVLQAMLSLLIIEKFRALYAYPFASFPTYSRFFTLLFGGFDKQDEAHISAILGIGNYTVAILVLAILLSIVIRSSYKLGVGLQSNGYILTVSIVCQLLVIGTYTFVL